MNILKHLTLVGVGFTALAVASSPLKADELSTSGEFIDGIAAVVNEGVVLKSELREQMEVINQRAQAEGMQLPPQDVLEEQVLERLIANRIQLQMADRYGIQISDQILNQAIAEVAERNGVAFEDMPAVMAQQGLSYTAYRKEMREQMTLEQLRRIDVLQRISVSPREIQQCLAAFQNDIVVNSEYDLSHILISLPQAATPEDIAAAAKQADDVYQLLQSGADFAQTAVRYSNSETALEGGRLGWRKGDQLPTIFADIVAPLESGAVSPPTRAASGFHIVKINDMRSANRKSEIEQARVRHILVTPNEIIDDATARQKLEDAVKRIEAGEEFAEVAKLVSDDPGSANVGGDMGWTSAGTFVPEFEEVVNTSEIGVLSAAFRSRFGWHVLEVTDRRIYDNTEDLKQSRCVQQIRNSKVAEETDLWVRRMRDDAYVDKRI